MEKMELRHLIACYLNGTLNAQQGEQLLLALEQEEAAVLALLGEMMAEPVAGSEPVDPEQMAFSLQKVLAVDRAPAPVIQVQRVHFLRRNWVRWTAAAVFIIAITTVVVVNTNRKDTEPGAGFTQNADVAAPGTNRAVVTLANGQVVSLDSLRQGLLAQQDGVDLVKLADGQIAYRKEDGEPVTELRYNTLTNPKGSKVIDMTLGDGTRVWLNAGSSVTYPVAFANNERKVQITGEACFEVAHDTRRPFYVTKGETQVRVLGTHFNVNAYEDEPDIKITLLEGSVEVENRQGRLRIRPGEQAVTIANKQPAIAGEVDTDQVMAWKNGLFQFNYTPMQSVFRELSRWYDIEVVYERGAPDIKLWGEMKRDLTLSQVLRGLGKIGVNFRIEGKKLIIL